MQFFDLRNLNYYCDAKGHLEQPVFLSLCFYCFYSSDMPFLPFSPFFIENPFFRELTSYIRIFFLDPFPRGTP